MQIIYKANDGTEFGSAAECIAYENKDSIFQKLKEYIDSKILLPLGDLNIVSACITNNIAEIADILEFKKNKSAEFIDEKTGHVYVNTHDDSGACVGCEFDTNYILCTKSIDVLPCGGNTIWIKKGE